ncbi:MAG: DUF4127 family protein [Fervidobacterium sp.]|uniref:DUF4127 family protein n=1 Tax=Fervidobacterium sp. TaxID=1871331 RepID=UPI00404B4199
MENGGKIRVLYLPLDERFCTKDYFLHLCSVFRIDVELPDALGVKKCPGDHDYVFHWLSENSNEKDLVLVSLDQYLHGGLIPSRTDMLTDQTLLSRLRKLISLTTNKKLNMYCAKTITRIPAYNSSDEEPDYWDFFGTKLHLLSLRMAKVNKEKRYELNAISELEEAKGIPEWVLKDFLWRRARNFTVNKKIIEYLAEHNFAKHISFMLDDNKEGSLSYTEAKELKEYAARYNANDVILSFRNGADEVMLTLLSKALSDKFSYKPRFYIVYTFPESNHLIPPYESLPLLNNVLEHVRAAGGQVTDSIEETDVILYVHNFNNEERTKEAAFQNGERWDSGRFNEFLKLSIEKEKVFAISDVRYANGSDNEFIENLLFKNVNWDDICYYAWNTAGNTIGSTCANAVLRALSKKGFVDFDSEKHKDFQAILILEHYGYQGNVRQKLMRTIENANEMMSYQTKLPYTVLPFERWAEEYVENELKLYHERICQAFKKKWKSKVYFPWHRTFEIGISLYEI